MKLSDPAPRAPLHHRAISIDGYLREDGLVDVEARLRDTKTYAFALLDRGDLPAGESLHEMSMRMTVDRDLVIVACEAATAAGPYTICPTGAARFADLAGLRIRAGFLKAAAERVGGALGCTHLREMLQQMATVAYQTMYSVRERYSDKPPHGEDDAAALIDSCAAFARSSPVVARRWPRHHRPAAGPG